MTGPLTDRIDDRYALAELLDGGGTGTGTIAIFRAVDLDTDRATSDVAIKIYDPRLPGVPFHREVARAMPIVRPSLVELLACGTLAGGAAYLVMEYLHGRTLERARGDAGLAPARVVTIAHQLVDGLEALHAAGIAHCAVTTSACFLLDDTDDHVKLLDASRERAAIAYDEEHAGVERSPVLWGDPHFISPERIRGERARPADDLWALGAVLFELLTGRSAFAADTATEVLHRILANTPDPLGADVPPRLESVILGLLAPVERRIASATEVRVLLDHCT